MCSVVAKLPVIIQWWCIIKIVTLYFDSFHGPFSNCRHSPICAKRTAGGGGGGRGNGRGGLKARVLIY